MKDFGGLVRSQFYSLRRESKLLIIMLAIMTFVGYLIAHFSTGAGFLDPEEALYGHTPDGSEMMGASADFFVTLGEIFLAVSVGLFSSRDFNDKTINYEIMNGHKREHVFYSRAIVTLILGTFGSAFMLIAVPAVIAIGRGWGTSISFGTMAMKVGLIMLLFMRMSAEIMLVASLIRRTAFVYITCTVVYFLEALLLQGAEHTDYILSFCAGSHIIFFKQFSLDHLDHTDEVFYYNTITPGAAAAIAVSYIVVTALCLHFGCKLFCRSDID